MRRPIPAPVSLSSALALIFLLPTFTAQISYDCNHIRVDGKKFDFNPLGGPHSVTTVDKDSPPYVKETTWTIDVCKPLRRTKGVKKTLECPNGTRVCGIEVDIKDDGKSDITKVMKIAGGHEGGGSGKTLDPKFERLKATDTNKEGLRMELHGGEYAKRTQKAVINFICSKDQTGNENLDKDKDEDDDTEDDRRRQEYKGEEKDYENNSLHFSSYGPDGDIDILTLDWHTKYACEDYEKDDDEDGSQKGSWGFFTWFIVIAFLGTAAYLIFGSWLNYNRYGARGWDLLPHGDTIRDIPYVLKDWWRKVMETISGPGSRGGYSAV